jgi:hypothetical protein
MEVVINLQQWIKVYNSRVNGSQKKFFHSFPKYFLSHSWKSFFTHKSPDVSVSDLTISLGLLSGNSRARRRKARTASAGFSIIYRAISTATA